MRFPCVHAVANTRRSGWAYSCSLTQPQKGETQLAIKETTLKGRRYVLCRNEEEARKDADRRTALLAGLDRKLANGDKALVSNKGFRRFVKAIGSGNFSIDYDKAEADAKFDGIFVLRTNTSAPRPAASLALRAVGVALPPTIRAAGETAAR